MTTDRQVPAAGQAGFRWKDTTRPVGERVDLLVAEMTLEEKLAQLGSRWVGNDMQESGGALSSDGPDPDRDETLNVAPMQDVFAAAAPRR